MTESITANLCLAFICVVWPGLWAWVAYSVGRHGGRGWLRRIVVRLKSWGGAAE